ncbi:8688_t:CDS:1, partial [Entrophospora sp. SA101]
LLNLLKNNVVHWTQQSEDLQPDMRVVDELTKTEILFGENQQPPQDELQT